MKKYYLLLFIIMSMFIISCGGHFFNPRYYYNTKSSDNSSGGESSNPGEDVDIGGSVPPDEDPFIKGEWNNPDYNGFDGTKIKDWFPRISFDNQNVPIYSFKKENRVWTVGNPTMSEYYFDASSDGNTAQGIGIKPMTIYKYEYKNPLIDPNGSYNSSDRMKRFLFYRIVGEAKFIGIGANLDQHLIAVDTYSKLIFAYAKIVSTYEIVGGNLVPNGFEALEYHSEKRGFYEYDPIGIVHEDGRVTLYEEYQNEMRISATKFLPQIHDPTRKMASYNGPGVSPYLVINIDDLPSLDENEFLNVVKSKKYDYRLQENYSYKNKDGQSVNVTGNGFVKESYQFSSDGKTISLLIEDEQTKTVRTENYKFVEGQKIVVNTKAEYELNGVKSYFRYDGNYLYKDDVLVGELNYNDKGPDFILRVRGARFESTHDGGIFGEDYTVVFQFSEDGGTVDVENMNGSGFGANTGDGRYYFMKERDDGGNKSCALYEWTGGKITLIGSNPWYGLILTDDNNTIARTTGVAQGNPGGLLIWSGNGSKDAYRK